MKKLESLKNLFIEQIKDLHDAETQLVEALPAMVRAASDDALKDAFSTHLRQTKIHAERLKKILGDLGEPAQGSHCKAMEGLLAEGAELINQEGRPAVKDAGLIAAAQRIEHYEIAGYGCARTFAATLGYVGAAELLQSTLDEEAETNENLTDIAEELNQLAEIGPGR
ncbi:MAG TPA: ferritin-like domain-containing protein [Opitutaceae bacterium]|nr:ferritin-like domain-containing protein [Opitutaceae bacterium]